MDRRRRRGLVPQLRKGPCDLRPGNRAAVLDDLRGAFAHHRPRHPRRRARGARDAPARRHQDDPAVGPPPQDDLDRRVVALRRQALRVQRLRGGVGADVRLLLRLIFDLLERGQPQVPDVLVVRGPLGGAHAGVVVHQSARRRRAHAVDALRLRRAPPELPADGDDALPRVHHHLHLLGALVHRARAARQVPDHRPRARLLE